ncbi:MAG: hypothetical protein JXA30_16095 [Deltaproteobacteria bacterium]|nr:hypothetical protein [Deltaproteobacteria bacterium]
MFKGKEVWQILGFVFVALVPICSMNMLVACGSDDDSDSPALTIQSKIGEIMASPDGEAVLRKCFGDEGVDNPRFSEMFEYDLPYLAGQSNGLIGDDIVNCVDQGLQALAK